MRAHRIASIGVLLLILLYGFFKVWFCSLYSHPVSNLVEYLGYSPELLLAELNSLSLGATEFSHFMGWLIYYPTYLGLHLLFIYLLFKKQQRMRKVLSFVLIILIGVLSINIVAGKAFGFIHLYKISYKLFQNLLGLPFILLAIEGGRILIRDIDSYYKDQTD